MRVILESSFARPGSAPIWGGKKEEFRDWTNDFTEHFRVICESDSFHLCACKGRQAGVTRRVTLILEKNYSMRGKSQNLFILRCLSYPHLALSCAKDRTIEFQYRTV